MWNTKFKKLKMSPKFHKWPIVLDFLQMKLEPRKTGWKFDKKCILIILIISNIVDVLDLFGGYLKYQNFNCLGRFK